MMRKGINGDRVFGLFVNLIGITIALIVLVPLIFVVAASFLDPDLVLRGKVLLIPKGITLKAYKMVFENREIWMGFANTLFYTAAGSAISLVLTIMAAYPLSRKNLPGRNLIMMLFLFTMYFNGGLVPTYLLVRNLNMYNTRWALLIPAAISTYNLIVARTYFENSIPEAL